MDEFQVYMRWTGRCLCAAMDGEAVIEICEKPDSNEYQITGFAIPISTSDLQKARRQLGLQLRAIDMVLASQERKKQYDKALERS